MDANPKRLGPDCHFTIHRMVGAPLPAARFASAQRKLYALIRRRQEESSRLAREAAALSVAPLQSKHVKTVKPA